MIKLVEKIYFDISTWKHYFPEDGFVDYITLNDINTFLTLLFKDDEVAIREAIARINIVLEQSTDIAPIDLFNGNRVSLSKIDSIGLTDMMYIKRPGIDPEPDPMPDSTTP